MVYYINLHRIYTRDASEKNFNAERYLKPVFKVPFSIEIYFASISNLFKWILLNLLISGINSELSLVESIVDGLLVQLIRLADPEHLLPEDANQLQKDCDLYKKIS